MLAAVLFPILAVAIILLYSYKENKAKKRAMEEGTAAQKSPVSPRELIAKGVESVIIVLLIAALIHIIENPTGLKFADSVNLGGSQTHTVRQFLGADAHNAIVLKTLQKSVVSGQTLDDGHGYIFSFFHRVHPSQKNDFIWSSG